MNILLELFITFSKIGCFTFGGGYAMIAMIEHNCVEKKQWITHDEMMNVTVIAESQLQTLEDQRVGKAAAKLGNRYRVRTDDFLKW